MVLKLLIRMTLFFFVLRLTLEPFYYNGESRSVPAQMGPSHRAGSYARWQPGTTYYVYPPSVSIVYIQLDVMFLINIYDFCMCNVPVLYQCKTICCEKLHLAPRCAYCLDEAQLKIWSRLGARPKACLVRVLVLDEIFL
jgi:hypothetical protein